MGWVGVTHVRRHQEHYHNRGGGYLYQGRFKRFPIQNDSHFLTVCRYVEANALRAKLVREAENWEFSSLWCRSRAGARQERERESVQGSGSPVPPAPISP